MNIRKFYIYGCNTKKRVESEFMKLFVKTAILALVASSSLSAICIGDDLRLEGGYRHDEYQHNFTTDAVIPGAAAFVNSQEFKVKNVDLGTFGIRGRFAFPQLDNCGCYDLSFLDNFYVTGFANWGWAGNESYSDSIVSGLTPVTTDYSGNLSYVRTHDYNIGLGYLIDLGCWFDPCSCIDLSNWALGISGGYQWDKQRYKVNSATVTVNGVELIGPAVFEEGLKIYQRWEGPWVGAQLFYEACGWRMDFGYEYHFDLHTRGKFNYTDSGLALGASDFSWHGHKGYSNVAFVNAYYDLCDGWDLGLGFKYQDWHSRNQSNSLDPTLVGVDVLSSGNNSKVWSYNVYGSVGYHF
jgi:hypothetical protein